VKSRPTNVVFLNARAAIARVVDGDARRRERLEKAIASYEHQARHAQEKRMRAFWAGEAQRARKRLHQLNTSAIGAA
jgi:hypothetical protein